MRVRGFAGVRGAGGIAGGFGRGACGLILQGCVCVD